MDENASKKRLKSLNTIQDTFESKANDFLCPICFELIREAHISKCGHTFCYVCICKCIEVTKKCPKCNTTLPNEESIFPNYLLNDLVTKHKMREDRKRRLFAKNNAASTSSAITTSGGQDTEESSDTLKSFLATESKKLALPDVNVMLEILTQRKILLEAESVVAQNRLVYEFLQRLLKQTEIQQQTLQKKIRLIKMDLTTVDKILKNVQNNCPKLEDVDKHFENKEVNAEAIVEGSKRNVSEIRKEMVQLITNIGETTTTITTDTESVKKSEKHPRDEGFNLSDDEAKNSSSNYKLRKQKIFAHFDDIVKSYFSARVNDLQFVDLESEDNIQTTTPTTASTTTTITPDTMETSSTTIPKSLEMFRENLVNFSRFTHLRTLSTLNYTNESNGLSTIVSSIEFDKDSEFFAIAGVTKRIKIFDYFTAIRDAVVDIKYPINEMVCNSKISCVAWNSYFKELLASSDYEGIVTIWDVETRTRKKTFQEHDKRSWSVDFNEIDSKLLASGSDDARVKLWSLECEHSVATLEVKANVCCVKFNPKSSCHLAFGSADHSVHYYDLRNMKEPLCNFKGHKKAVSYVKFLNTHELVSAGTDGTLKMWDVNNPPYCKRTFFGGHVNEKNFVGLATNGDYLACGSEDNSLCVYYKGLTKQMFNMKFDQQNNNQRYPIGGLFDIENKALTNTTPDTNDFVSAVCWRKKTNTIIAGNSRGIIKILELV